MKILHQVAFVLTIVGALNWGFVGLFNLNLVEAILGVGTSLTMIIYILVGISAVYIAATHMNTCTYCMSKKTK